MFKLIFKSLKPLRSIVLPILVFFGLSGYAQELRPSNLFTEHMVLQRGQKVPVWGKASPNENITVTFAKQTKTTTADKDGNWSVHLDALTASTIGRDLVIFGKEKIVISDVLVGEVWICSGQSNMQLEVGRVPEVEGLIPFAKNIRSFEVKKTVSFAEEKDILGKWVTTYPNSAVAFSFAYFLKDIGDVPVGIILSSWGSSSLEAWIPKDMIETLPHFKTIMQAFDADTDTRDRIESILGKKEGWPTEDDIFLRRQPNILYNAMMKPLAPFSCKGLVWYQGERNTRYLSGMPKFTKENWFHQVAGMKEYGGILKKWIERYRQEWQNDKMNFMIVMLPGFGKGTVGHPDIDMENPTAESWAWMRESQLQVLDLPYTSVVNTIDLGEANNVHPLDKLPIGQRLALLAAKNTLNQDIIATGPTMESVEILEKSIRIHFKNAEGLKTLNGKDPTGFWISDALGNWKKAKASIVKETVVLSSPELEHPKYVRYAFSGKPKVNLVNGIGLPTYPFRTDDFGH